MEPYAYPRYNPIIAVLALSRQAFFTDEPKSLIHAVAWIKDSQIINARSASLSFNYSARQASIWATDYPSP
jgi:hypothetical protein